MNLKKNIVNVVVVFGLGAVVGIGLATGTCVLAIGAGAGGDAAGEILRAEVDGVSAEDLLREEVNRLQTDLRTAERRAARAASRRDLEAKLESLRSRSELRAARREASRLERRLGWEAEALEAARERARYAREREQHLSRVLLGSGDPIHRLIGYVYGVHSGAVSDENIVAAARLSLARQRAMMGVDSLQILQAVGVPIGDDFKLSP